MTAFAEVAASTVAVHLRAALNQEPHMENFYYSKIQVYLLVTFREKVAARKCAATVY
jgi:hypothetical protein